jgi:hypothetical protein
LFDCRPINRSGIYSLNSEKGLADLFTANVDSREGNLETASLETVAGRLKIDNYKVIPADKSSGTIVSESRYGRELWKIFLWAAAMLLAVEMLLSREKEAEPEIG